MSYPFSWLTGLLSALATNALFLIVLPAQAPASYYYLPSNPSVDDSLQFMVSWGTEDDSLEEVSTFSCTLHYSGFQIDPGSLCFIDASDSSWFLQNCDFNSEISIDTSQRRIDLSVTLEPDSLRSGYGHCLTLGGPVIIIDDEFGKRESAINDLSVQWHLWYDRTGRKLGPERPGSPGLYLREGADKKGNIIRKLTFIY